MLISPLMVNLSLAALTTIKSSLKPLIEAMLLNYVLAPVLIFLLSWLFIPDPKIRLGLMMLSIAPASSMGLGYLGLAGGHMLSGAVIVAVAFILSIVVYPLAGTYFAAGAHIQVSSALILKNLTVVLIIPLILGVLTREYIEKNHEEGTFYKIKPYFSVITLSFLYILLFLIFTAKAKLIISNYLVVFSILPVAVLFYGITILLATFLNKNILKFEYGHHQSIVFTSIGKNVALSIAILVSVFGKDGQYMAIAPAIMSLIQAPVLMFYLKLSEPVEKYFEFSRV